MSLNRVVWPSIAFAAAAGAFFSVRAALPGSPAAADRGEAVPALQAGLQPSTEVDHALGGAGKENDALTRQLDFLDSIDRADLTELRRMFFDAQSTRRGKHSIAQRWAETDARSLYDFLKGLSRTEWENDAGLYNPVSSILFRTWVLQDADAALAAADALRTRPQFLMARWAMVATLLGSHPAKGFALAAKLPYPDDSQQDPVLEVVWKKNPAVILQAAGEGPLRALNNSEVRAVVDNAFGELLRKDAAAAAVWLKSLPAQHQRLLWGPMALQFAKADPAAATAWFKDMPPSADRENAGAEIVKGWATRDPHAALDWLLHNLQGSRPEGLNYLARVLTAEGIDSIQPSWIDSTQQLFYAMPPGPERDVMIGKMARIWAEKDFKPAIAWVFSLPAEDPGCQSAKGHLIHLWPEKDLTGAAAHILDNPDSQAGKAMYWQVIREFNGSDPGGGIAWLARLPAGSQKQALLAFFHNALTKNELPVIFAAMEPLPADQQEAMLGIIAAEVLTTTSSSNMDEDAPLLNSLQQLPASLREVARIAIQKSASGSTERKEAALKALK